MPDLNNPDLEPKAPPHPTSIASEEPLGGQTQTLEPTSSNSAPERMPASSGSKLQTSSGGEEDQAPRESLKQPSTSEEQGQDTDQGGEEPQGDEGSLGHTPTSFVNGEQIGWLTKDINKAIKVGDSKTAARLMDEQFAKVMQGLVGDEVTNGLAHPLLANPAMAKSNPQVAMEAAATQIARRELMIGPMLQKHGWDDIRNFGQSIVDRYKQANKAPLISESANMTPEQLQAMSYQFEPVRVDPNEIANYRQRLVKLDNDMKTLGTSVWNNPRTARIAQILNAEAGPGTPGYLKSEEQSITAQMPIYERALLPIRFGAEAALDIPISLGMSAAAGLERLGYQALNGMTLNNADAHYNSPTAWVQDQDGSWYNNGGKVGASELVGGIWHMLTGQLIDQQMAEYGDAKSAAIMREHGIESLATVVGTAVGSAAPYMATGGLAMGWLGRGLGWLATGGKAVESLSRAAKITQVLASTVGAMAGNGTYEAAANGRIEGYGTAFLGGAVAAPMMMLIGSMGKSVERLLARTDKIPAKLAQMISGGVEGVGFAHMDLHTLNAAWQFLKDPNKDTFAEYGQIVLANTIAMAAIKGVSGTTPGQLARESVTRGAETPEAAAKAATDLGATPEAVTAHGEALRQREVTAGKLPEQAAEAHQRVQETGERLNLEQAGLAQTEPEKQDVRFSTVEELRRIKEMPAGHEKNQAIIDALNRSRGALGKSFAKFAEDVVPKVIGREELGRAKEIGEAGQTIAKMLGVRYQPPERGVNETGNEPSSFIQHVTPGETPIVSSGAETERLEARTEPRAPQPGTPASQRMQPSLEQEGVPGTAKIRGSDVLRDFQGYEGDPVRVPIRQGVGIRGRQSTKGILGWFHNHENILRLKGAQDLVTAAHEWTHAMDRATDFPSEDVKNVAGLKAAAATYPGLEKLPEKQQRSEGWAEFWARHMLDDPQLKRDTGAFHDEAMKWLAAPERASLRGQMERTQQLLRQYRDQGAVQRVESTMHFFDEKPSLQELRSKGVMENTLAQKAKGFVKSTLHTLNKAIADDVAGLRKAQTKWMEMEYGKEGAAKRLAEMSITDNPTRLFDVLRMTAGRQTERMVLDQTHDLAGKVTGEGLAKPYLDVGGKDYKKFATYLNAKRSLEIIAKGKEANLPKADYQTTVAKLETPEWLAASKEIRAGWDRVLDYAKEGGLFSPEQVDAIKNSYETYIPFQRVLEGPKQFSANRGVAERGTGVKKLEGSQYEIKDPLNATANGVRQIITKTQQAMVMKAMLKQTLLHEGQGGLVTLVKRDTIASDHPLAKIIEALRGAEGTASGSMKLSDVATELQRLEEAGEIGGAITLFGEQTVPSGHKPIIAFTPHFTESEIADLPTDVARRMATDMNHKLQWLETDVDAFDALMGIDNTQTIIDKLPGFVQTLLRLPAQMTRVGSTVFNLAFQFRNFLRDAVSESVYSKESSKFGIFSAIGRGITGAVEIVKGGEGAELFEHLGGMGSSFFANEISSKRAASEMVGINRGIWGTLRHAYGKVVDALSTGEEAFRVNAFKTARARALTEGKTELEANLIGLEEGKGITTDFTRGGTAIRALNQLIPYSKAAVNASEKFIKTLSGDYGAIARRNAFVRGMTGITVPTLALWWLNKDKEWYQQLPEWQRLNWWHVEVPGFKDPIRIPKPYEIGKLFANIPEMMLDEAHSKDPVGVANTMWDMVTGMLPNSWMPSVLAPIAEVATNHDFFTGRQVVPDWLERSKMPHDQVTAYTKWYGKMLSDALGFTGYDISPIKLEHLTDTLTGGLVGHTSDLATQIATLGGLLSGEGYKPEQLPAVGQFLGAGKFKQSRAVQQFYDLDKELTQKAGSKELTGQERGVHVMINAAKERLAFLRKEQQRGGITREELDEQSYRIAQQVLDRAKP